MWQALWKTAAAWPAIFAVDCYITFVAQHLWDWFAVPALQVSSIRFWEMFGLILLGHLLTAKLHDPIVVQRLEHNWQFARRVFKACAPEDMRDALVQAEEDESKSTR